jgi:hypothetical protein
MIYGISMITVTWFHRYWAVKMREQYCARFEKIVASDEPFIVRTAASLAWINMSSSLGTPSFILRTLGDAIALHVWRDIFDEFRKPFFAPSIIEAMRSASSLGEALSAENMTSEAAHLIIREMLERVFARTGGAGGWYDYAVDLDNSTAHIYTLNEYRSHRSLYHPGKPLNRPQKATLETIVNCDVFWRIPTNLFSFFYGLPDSRDKLRALLTT